jgi:hypothetical protein
MKQPRKKKVPLLKVGQEVRILLGPRQGQTDTIKEVRETLQHSPVYFLNGDTERLAYLSHAVVDEKKAKFAEQMAQEAHSKGQQNNTNQDESAGKSEDKPGIDKGE